MIKTRDTIMQLNSFDLDQLRATFAVCQKAGIDAVVITDNQVRGIAPTSKMAILSQAKFSFDPELKIGIGRIGEFEKRAAIFVNELAGEGKVNDSNEVSVLTLQSGKSKVQFRCTAERMIKYPKSNEDEAVVTVTAKKAEIVQVSRAVKTLGAEFLTIAIGRDGAVKFECSAPTNELFVIDLETEADFIDDPQGIVHIYEGDRLATVLDAAARDEDEVQLIIGEIGSITLSIKGHTLVAMPEANQEDDDE